MTVGCRSTLQRLRGGNERRLKLCGPGVADDDLAADAEGARWTTTLTTTLTTVARPATPTTPRFGLLNGQFTKSVPSWQCGDWGQQIDRASLQPTASARTLSRGCIN